MAKKNKKKKNRGLFGNGVAGGAVTGVITGILAQVLTEAVETYFSDKKTNKIVMKMLRRLTSQRAYSRA